MTNLPIDTTFGINADKGYLLQVGSNPDTYIMLQDAILNLERPEIAETTSGGGKTYFYGPGDNWFEAVMLMSLNEYATFNTNSQRDANGALAFQYYRIKATDLNGNFKTIGNTGNTPPGFKGKLPRVRIEKPVVGGVKVRLRIRLIEDTITVT